MHKYVYFLHCILSDRTIFSPIARTVESEKPGKRSDWLMSTWRGEPSRNGIKVPATKGLSSFGSLSLCQRVRIVEIQDDWSR